MMFFYDNVVNLYDFHRLYADVRMNFGQDCSLAAPQIYFFTGTPALIIHKIKTKEINTEAEFGYVIKYSSECFILHLKQMRILGEN